MTDEPRQDPVGNVGEEAAKLLGALQAWARESGTESTGAAAAAAESPASSLGRVNEHIATGGEDCRYCPLCQVISAVRETSPEVRAHLSSAASSLFQAAAGALASEVPATQSRSRGPVEKIDLTDDTSWEED